MIGFFIKLRTALALGIVNLLRVTLYRLSLKFGIHPVQKLKASVPQGPFFLVGNYQNCVLPCTQKWQDRAFYFGWFSVALHNSPPDWYLNPFTNKSIDTSNRPWWQIPDFGTEVGDIKAIWEASRFDWVLSFAQQAKLNDKTQLERLNAWLDDWCRKNPPYFGFNWKCGQEASIRVMHLAMAALILEQTENPTLGLKNVIKIHLQRIATTLSYAIAQDNNHGTSEAAALYIGGSWLELVGDNAGSGWHKLGRKWLENRVFHLIENDGSFSQYSVNYHRMMLDTMCMVELWRRHLNLSPFPENWQSRIVSAVYWLYAMVDSNTGDAPNLGANDGAHLLALSDADYRDFRPSVQLSMVLFVGKLAYQGNGAWNNTLDWLGVKLPVELAIQTDNYLFDNGGYAVFRKNNAMVLLRFPRFRFRPSQADALHVDLWVAGKSLLSDAGTYSYNTDKKWLDYFSGTFGHNTIQFDNRDQMPRLSRFLFGEWLKSSYELISLADGNQSFRASYRDYKNASHTRSITLTDDGLSVYDEIAGFKDKAILRWRLCPGQWQINDQSLTLCSHSLNITASAPIIRFEIVEGWESRYYSQKTSAPVLEIELSQAGKIVTEFRLHS